MKRQPLISGTYLLFTYIASFFLRHLLSPYMRGSNFQTPNRMLTLTLGPREAAPGVAKLICSASKAKLNRPTFSNEQCISWREPEFYCPIFRTWSNLSGDGEGISGC